MTLLLAVAGCLAVLAVVAYALLFTYFVFNDALSPDDPTWPAQPWHGESPK